MASLRERPPEEAAVDTSFARGLRLLLVVSDRGEMRADELATALGMPLSSVYRYLRTLAAFGFVDRHADRYRLGPRLHIGSGPLVTLEQLVRQSDAVLADLAAATGETAVVVRRVGLAAVVVHEAPAPDPLRVSLQADRTLPLVRGALGQALLAWAPAEIVAEAADQAAADGSLDRMVLEQQLRSVRRLGYAADSDDLTPGATSIAVPILMPDGIVGAIALVAPSSRSDETSLRRMRARLRESAALVAMALSTESPS
jgi:IclR family transcriptional regulator, acetate operon repressor